MSACTCDCFIPDEENCEVLGYPEGCYYIWKNNQRHEVRRQIEEHFEEAQEQVRETNISATKEG